MVNNHYSNTLRQLINTAYKRIAERGEVIAATDNLRSIFCIKEGFTKRFLIKNDGSISVQAIYGPGDCFGITTLTGLLLDSKNYNGSETYYYEAIKHTVATGIGIAVLSAFAVRTELAAKTLMVVPIKGMTIRRPLYRIQRKGMWASPSLRAFIEMHSNPKEP